MNLVRVEVRLLCGLPYQSLAYAAIWRSVSSAFADASSSTSSGMTADLNASGDTGGLQQGAAVIGFPQRARLSDRLGYALPALPCQCFPVKGVNAMAGPPMYSAWNPPPLPPNFALAKPMLRIVLAASCAPLVSVNAAMLLGFCTGRERESAISGAV